MGLDRKRKQENLFLFCFFKVQSYLQTLTISVIIRYYLIIVLKQNINYYSVEVGPLSKINVNTIINFIFF